jgi:hypothetical protein
MSNPWSTWLSNNDTQRFVLSRKQGWNEFVHATPRSEFEVLSQRAM